MLEFGLKGALLLMHSMTEKITEMVMHIDCVGDGNLMVLSLLSSNGGENVEMLSWDHVFWVSSDY